MTEALWRAYQAQLQRDAQQVSHQRQYVACWKEQHCNIPFPGSSSLCPKHRAAVRQTRRYWRKGASA